MGCWLLWPGQRIYKKDEQSLCVVAHIFPIKSQIVIDRVRGEGWGVLNTDLSNISIFNLAEGWRVRDERWGVRGKGRGTGERGEGQGRVAGGEGQGAMDGCEGWGVRGEGRGARGEGRGARGEGHGRERGGEGQGADYVLHLSTNPSPLWISFSW